MRSVAAFLAVLSLALSGSALAQQAIQGVTVNGTTYYPNPSTGYVTLPSGAMFAGYGAPNTRTLAQNTAYQCTDPTRSCEFSINLSSAPTLTLAGGSTNTASIIIGPTSAVASGAGTAVGSYSNALTGTVVVGIALNAGSQNTVTVPVPAGYYMAIRTTSGTVTVSSAYDSSVG